MPEDKSSKPEDKNNKYNIYDHDICNISSANDCTGLIPAITDTGEGIDFYHEIYSFENPVSQKIGKDGDNHP